MNTNRFVQSNRARAFAGIALAAAFLTQFAPSVARADSISHVNITRKEVATRAQQWISQKVTYNTNAIYSDGYRRDCSGFVSMALKLKKPGPSTVSLPSLLVPISKSQLKTGDVIGKLGPGTGGAGGHVLMFERWLDANRYVAFELHGPKGAVVGHYSHRFPYDGRSGYKAYRYTKIAE